MKWIRLSDKKPKKDGSYLVSTQEGFIMSSEWTGCDFNPDDPYDPIVWYTKLTYPEE